MKNPGSIDYRYMKDIGERLRRMVEDLQYQKLLVILDYMADEEDS